MKSLQSRYTLNEYLKWNVRHRARWSMQRIRERLGSVLASRRVFDRYSKVLMIRSHHENAGFFAVFTFVLNQLRLAEQYGYYPVVHLGRVLDDGAGVNAFFDPAHGDNVWEYYFEPVSDHTAAQILRMVEDPDEPIGSDDLVSFSTDHLWYVHQYASSSIYAYNYGYYRSKEKYDARWYERNRRLAHRVIERYVRLEPELLEEIDAYHRSHMAGNPVVGVHMRGTDKGTAEATPRTMRIVQPEEYVPHIDAFLGEHPSGRVFCASDQRQFIEAIRERYGERTLSLDAIRSDGNRAPFQIDDGKNYQKGKDVLMDCLLLSRCDFLLKCTSHVGEAALWFRPDLPHLDLNH